MSNSRELSELASKVTVNGDVVSLSGNVGIGVTDAVSPLTVRRASGAISALQGSTSAASTLCGYLAFQNAFATTADGTALARVGFGTAANTGAGFLSFETSSGSSSPAERMRIDSAGNVGIGRTPTYRLDLEASSATDITTLVRNTNASFCSAYVAVNDLGTKFGAIGVVNSSSTLGPNYGTPGEVFIRASTSADGLVLTSVNSSGYIRFQVASAERMRIDSAGNVGVGVTPTTGWHSGTKATQIGAHCAVSGNNSLGYAELLNNCYNTAASSFAYSTNNAATRYSQQLGTHAWYSAPTGAPGSTATFSQVMTLNASGNLGLGITPATGWHSGTKVIQIGTFGAVSCIISTGYTELLNNCYNTTTSSFAYLTSNAATRYSQQLGAHVWYSAPTGTAGSTSAFTQAMALLANNNLLLGTTSDSGYRFTLNGNGTYFTDATYSGIIGKASVVQGSAAITPTADFAVRSDSNLIIFAGGGTERSRVTTAGNQIDYQPAESAQNTSATLTIAQLRSQIITSNAAVTLTLPTGTALEGYTNAMAVNTSFEVVFIATTANAITIAANGNTTIGNLTVSGNTSGVFRFRKTATNSFTVYRAS